MKFTTRSKLLVVPAVLLLAPLVRAEAPERFASTADLRKVRTSACNPANPMAGMITPATPPETLLFNVAAPTGAASCPPVLAPDGHQITLGEFRQADGTVKVKCINTGTHSIVHFSGLIPGGTYTVWQFIFANGGPPTPFTAVGAVGDNGITGAIQNFFTASADGEGQLSVTTPPGPLSAAGTLNGCWLDNPEVRLELVYHIDGLTHGPVPGMGQLWVFQAVFVIM
jgi:hypothetical protein